MPVPPAPELVTVLRARACGQRVFFIALALSSLTEAESGKYIHTPSFVVKSDDDNAAVKEADDFALLGRPPLPSFSPFPVSLTRSHFMI